MAQFLCPQCGSTYFVTSKIGLKTIFQVGYERTINVIEAATVNFSNDEIDTHTVFCGACSWQGGLGELVESYRD